ncbi:MAG: TRAP transporter small permease [Firmicutes bacterium]|jgi:TRAP-type C4-dicarboxylate transport system permease small subunit|nr:TRAP transporter small permease [Bacillota bacterium]MDH7495692.1 TRAP transporter small permease [Bacillota bacterium]
MSALNYAVYYCNKVLRIVGNLILAAILLVITAGIVSRYVFRNPFTWTEEISTLLMVSLGYVSGAVVTIEKKHVVADFLISNASPRFKRAVSFVSKVLAVAVFTLICVSSYHMLLPKIVYRTAALGIPRNLFYWPLFSMCVVMIFAVLVDILNEIFPGRDTVVKLTRERDLSVG